MYPKRRHNASMKANISLFSVFLLITTALNAQTITVSGFVANPFMEPVENVNILDLESKTGTTSDNFGRFSMTITAKKTALQFSHVTYETQTLGISKKQIDGAQKDGNLWLEIVLEPKLTDLQTVEILGDNIVKAHQDSRQWVSDYELIGEDKILLLVIENNKKYAQLVDARDSVLAKTKIHNTYNALFQDCNGFLYVLSDNYAARLFLFENQFFVGEKMLIAEFHHHISPCIISTPRYAYEKRLSGMNQKVEYFRIDKKTQYRMSLTEIFDQERAEFIEYYLSVNTDPKIKTLREIERARNFAQLILAAPATENALIQLFDALYLFNSVENKIIKYDFDGEYIGETTFDFKKTGRKFQIITDVERKRCFALVSTQGRASLKEINPDSGEILRTIPVERHIFPQKVAVRGDQVYYLSKDYFPAEGKLFLWKQNID